MSPGMFYPHTITSSSGGSSASMFPQLMMSQGFNNAAAIAHAFSQSTHAADQVQESPASQSLDSLLKSSSSSMVDSTSEMGDEGDAGHCSATSQQLGAMLQAATCFLTQKKPQLQLEPMFCNVEAESPGGPLSRGDSEDSEAPPSLKRHFEDSAGTWMQHQQPHQQLQTRNLAARHQHREESIVFQDNFREPPAVQGYVEQFQQPMDQLAAVGAAPPLPFGNAGAQAANPEQHNEKAMASIRAIMFSSPLQPVPSMEEIAKSRPKRRNVKISKDPQSVAARHRRERISDRIRVLQRLVPGGTKMDTASMLDEAIHYVKFLKLQLQVQHSLLPPSLPSLPSPYWLSCSY